MVWRLTVQPVGQPISNFNAQSPDGRRGRIVQSHAQIRVRPVYQLPLIAVSMRLAQSMRNVTTPARHVVSPRILCQRSKGHEIELESVVVYDEGQAREYV